MKNLVILWAQQDQARSPFGGASYLSSSAFVTKGDFALEIVPAFALHVFRSLTSFFGPALLRVIQLTKPAFFRRSVSMVWNLCCGVATAVPQFTGGQIYIEVDRAGAYLVLARTGARLQILEAEVVEISEVVPLIDETFETAPFQVANGRFEAIERLSAREHQVFSMLGDGLDMNEIAAQFGISKKTVERRTELESSTS